MPPVAPRPPLIEEQMPKWKVINAMENGKELKPLSVALAANKEGWFWISAKGSLDRPENYRGTFCVPKEAEGIHASRQDESMNDVPLLLIISGNPENRDVKVWVGDDTTTFAKALWKESAQTDTQATIHQSLTTSDPDPAQRWIESVRH
jgi:hypothetical protein